MFFLFPAFPGCPAPPKIVSAFKDCINLAWLPPSSTGGGSIIGYNLEKRKKGSNVWSQANPKDDPIKGLENDFNFNESSLDFSDFKY